MFLTGPEPIHAVEMLPSAPQEPYGMYCVECAVELAVLDGAALDRLHEMFIAVADELGAELALAEVLENWDHTYNGSVMPGSQAQYPQELGMGDMVVAGLPMRPVPWCYFGPAYARLLSGFLSGAPAQWKRLRTARGLDVRLSGSPVPAEELPSDWFPRRLLHVAAAAVVPREHPVRRPRPAGLELSASVPARDRRTRT